MRTYLKAASAARSETVTVRLDRKLRYLAELAARKQRRTLSSFVEWAIEDVLGRVVLAEDDERTVTVRDEARNLWDVEEADRFAKLALRYPDLLTHTEQLIWKIVRDSGFFWIGCYMGLGRQRAWTWRQDEESLAMERLRNHWETLEKIATGQADRSALPEWSPPEDDGDDGIPF